MGWEADLFAALDDLEGRAESVLGRERDWEVAEQARAEYASIDLSTRLMASLGREVSVDVSGAGRLSGVLRRCTGTWLLLEGAGREWVVAYAGLLAMTGASERALPAEAWPVAARVGLGSAVRRLADQAGPVLVLLRDGSRREGTWGRVGRDFAELLLPDGGSPLLVPFDAIAALSQRSATA